MSGTTNSNDSAVVVGPRHQTLPIGSLLVTPTGGSRGRLADMLAVIGSGTVAGPLTIGVAPQNILTITPGTTATDPTVLAPGGAGGLQITGGTDARSLSINHSGGTIPVIASSVTNALQFAGAANESTGIGVMTFGTGNPTFSGVHAGGTLAAAAATPINSVLFAITGSGHDGTQYITPSRAQIQIAAAELWSATANGTDIRFLTTAATTLTRTEKLRLTSTGSLLLGVTGTNNTLTVTPGAAATDAVTMAPAGSGGIQITAGRLNLSAIPTSAAGLVAGDVWRNGTVLTIV